MYYVKFGELVLTLQILGFVKAYVDHHTSIACLHSSTTFTFVPSGLPETQMSVDKENKNFQVVSFYHGYC